MREGKASDEKRKLLREGKASDEKRKLKAREWEGGPWESHRCVKKGEKGDYTRQHS